jgi:hypothetical protein
MRELLEGCASNLSCHRPPPGRRDAPPDDRLQRVIQYAAASRLITSASGILDHPLSRVTTAVIAGRSCRNGYRFAKSHGKPNFANRRKPARGKHFCDFPAIHARATFTSRSSRYLNCPSNLIGHDHPNKPANGVGE